MKHSTTFHTAQGYAIKVFRVGLEIELVTSDAKGDVISTVRMSSGDAWALLDSIDEAL